MKIDISDSIKAADVYNMFDSFKSKKELLEYYNLSDNSDNLKYINEIANKIGFDFGVYKKRRSKPLNHCLYCGKEIPRSKKFCNCSHSAKYWNKRRKPMSDNTKKKISNSLHRYRGTEGDEISYIEKRKLLRKNNPCPICGIPKNVGNHSICKHRAGWFSQLECFGFNTNTIGTPDVIKEFEKTRDLLIDEYVINKKSCAEIKEQYGYTKSTENLVITLRDAFSIKLRDSSSCISNAVMNMRTSPGRFSHFDSGWDVSWNGKEYFYRSSYEHDYAKHLDLLKKDYVVEGIRISYFDTKVNKERIAIPDFLINDDNLIAEVKSRVTLVKQNMKDKFDAYISKGYNVVLVYEGKEYTYDEFINDINEYSYVYHKNLGL